MESFAFNDIQSPEIDDSDFIGKLYSRLAEMLSVDKTHIEESLSDDNLYRSCVREACIFIEGKKVTHYISAIYLGAAKYCKSSSTVDELRECLNDGDDITSGTSLKDRMKFMKRRGITFTRVLSIGDMTSSDRSAQKVVYYDILPISHLLHDNHTRIKLAVDEAIKEYLSECISPPPALN